MACNITKGNKMTFMIDNFFIEEFNNEFGTDLTYKQFAFFQKATRFKKHSLGLVNSPSGYGGHFKLSEKDKEGINEWFPDYLLEKTRVEK